MERTSKTVDVKQDDSTTLLDSINHVIRGSSASLSESGLIQLKDNLNRLSSLLRGTHGQPIVSKENEVYRKAGALKTALSVLRWISSSGSPGVDSSDSAPSFLDLLNPLLFIIAEVDRDSSSSISHLNIDGSHEVWDETISLVQRFSLDHSGGAEVSTSIARLTRVFDVLLATALGREQVIPIFRSSRSGQTNRVSTSLGDGLHSDQGTNMSSENANVNLIAELDKLYGPKLALCSPLSAKGLLQMSISILRPAASIPRTETRHQYQVRPFDLSMQALALNTLTVVLHLASVDDNNLAAFHAAKALELTYQALLSESQETESTDWLYRLARRLLRFGFSGLEDARQLLSRCTSFPLASQLLLDALKISQEAPHFTFDLSHNGYASLEFPELKHPFPAADPAKGYSLMLWVRIDRFDDRCHTTLFGAFDISQTCFLLVYLDRRNRTLVLQTSTSSEEPSVRFKNVDIHEGIFYHVGLVHRKSRRNAPGKVSLFVDGVLRDQVRCPLPMYPPIISTGGAGHSHTKGPAPVQAFFGTPQALSPSPRPGILKSKWSLGTGHLINEALPDELVYVYHKLGPLYRGNFQDSLGSFQSYSASALVNIYNEKLHPGQESQSIISTAVKSHAGFLNPESNMLVSISPGFNRPRPGSYDSCCHRSSRKRSLATHEAQSSIATIANAASPSMYEARAKKIASGSIMGGTVVLYPLTMQECSWRLLGCLPLGLHMVAHAREPDQLIRAVSIFFESLNDNWRNSEAIERTSGYSILSWLLQKKYCILDQGSAANDYSRVNLIDDTAGSDVSSSLLRLILRASTLNYGKGTKAMITNPLAYRMLVVDNDLWQHTGVRTQRLFFDQMITFLSGSEYRLFNAKRLTRMRIFKRFIEILKESIIPDTVSASIMDAFRALLAHSASADTLRSLALYITYAINMRYRARANSELNGAYNPRTDGPVGLHDHDLGVRVLQMLRNFLCEETQVDSIRRFARSVTTKWLLQLLESDDEQVVEAATTILSRMLVVSGDSYRLKFESKNGYIVLAHTLRKWCFKDQIWLSMFALFFGLDTGRLRLNDLSDVGRWLTSLHAEAEAGPAILCPCAFEVMASMLEEGLVCLTSSNHSSSASCKEGSANGSAPDITAAGESSCQEVARDERSFLYVISLVSAMLGHVDVFHDFMAASEPLRSLLKVLFAATNGPLTSLSGSEEVLSSSNVIAVSDEVLSQAPSMLTISRHRRVSEYVVLDPSKNDPTSTSRYSRPLAPSDQFFGHPFTKNGCFSDFLRLLVMICIEQIISRKEFTGLGIFLKAPEASSARRSWLNSLIQSRILATLRERLENDSDLFQLPKMLTNVIRFIQQTSEAAIEGWFVDESCSLIRLIASFLRCVEQRDIRNLKSVRLCAPSIASTKQTLLKLVLFSFGILSHSKEHTKHARKARGESRTADTQWSTPSLETLCSILRQTSTLVLATTSNEILLENPIRMDPRYVPAFVLVLYELLLQGPDTIRLDLLQLFREIVAPNLVEAKSCLQATALAQGHDLVEEFFFSMLRSDDNSAIDYVLEHVEDLTKPMSDVPRAALDSIIHESNSQAEQNARIRLLRREERLNADHLTDLSRQHALTEHAAGSRSWNDNITQSETYKSARTRQDRQESAAHLSAQFDKCEATFKRLVGVSQVNGGQKWALDESEGRDRMRLRLAPTTDAADLNYTPKRATRNRTLPTAKQHASPPLRSRATTVAYSTPAQSAVSTDGTRELRTTTTTIPERPQQQSGPSDEYGFELVDSPNANEDVEDKNRKVMRSLQQGEQVHNVYNVSRIRGLEACEGLLILGAKAMYLVDNLFQRADAEIVNTGDAPADERDPYVQMIAGRPLHRNLDNDSTPTIITRHWPWQAVISISKRNFLLRPAAIEVFFEDGRSYLLTASSPVVRDKIYKELAEKSARVQASMSTSNDNDAWRSELLVSVKEPAITVTGRFANALNFAPSFLATARWTKGELSNFQYLMLINTLAGRTFNDLTQYPVFPWVLSDYTSKELDLTNPRSFRDFSKPMGCQSPEREIAFRDRYKTFAEMSDDPVTAFHYGTHYSTAMIVTSYLIRLQPYVDSYLLLQGGSFDHADRLFYSVEKAWASASQTNMTDVRELTPEFFYLPEMFKNMNKYDFGRREATGELIQDIELPPWAKGDPRIFVAKHREALESPHVSQNLHQWIDLVFGFKQRGEAAIEATNVFHHLSYQGSINPDNIEDPMERLATIGIIHNFGQTPRQVFSRPHEQRDTLTSKTRRLHRGMEWLSASSALIFEYHSRICEIDYFTKQQRVICAGPCRSFMHPSYGIVLDWGYVDGSIRFWKSDTRKTQPLAIYEQLHQDEIAAAVFADATLVTTSRDCTIALWKVTPNLEAETVDLQPETFLFGHREPVTVLAVSTVLSLVVSADIAGRALLWDLNTHELIREIALSRPAESARINSSNGHLMFTCGDRILLYTVNGEEIIDQDISVGSDDVVSCCAFYEITCNDWIDTELIFTGHRRGVANIWKLGNDEHGKWLLKHLRRLDHIDRSQTEGRNLSTAITAIRPTDTSVYTGDESGRVYEWKCTR